MCACSWRYHPVFFFRKNISIRWSNVCFNDVILDLKNPQFRTKSRYFTDNSAGWNLATNSFHRHVRLLMEISLHTFFLKKYFDPMEEYVFQWRHFWELFFWLIFLGWCHWNTHFSNGSKYFFKKKVCGDISMSRRTCWWNEFVSKCHPTELSVKYRDFVRN